MRQAKAHVTMCLYNSKPALRSMERSGYALSAGRRPLQKTETGLISAHRQLDNGGIKI